MVGLLDRWVVVVGALGGGFVRFVEPEVLAPDPAQDHLLDAAEVVQVEGQRLVHGSGQHVGRIVEVHLVQTSDGAQSLAAVALAETAGELAELGRDLTQQLLLLARTDAPRMPAVVHVLGQRVPDARAGLAARVRGRQAVTVEDMDFMDGAMLITPLPDHIRFDASFGDGDVSFKLVLFGDKAAVQLLDMGLPVHVAEARVNTMLEFADVAEDDGSQHITKRRCMIKFGTIAAVCAGAAALGVGGAVVPCAFYLVDSLCECLPLLGYDPCN